MIQAIAVGIALVAFAAFWHFTRSVWFASIGALMMFGVLAAYWYAAMRMY